MNTITASRPQKLSLYIMAALYIAAGINHFVSPKFYAAIMPPYIPFHTLAIFVSGAAESILGFLLLFNHTRKAASWGIVIVLLAIFPANVQMLVNYIKQNNPFIWVAVLRLPLQALLIWWALKQKNLII